MAALIGRLFFDFILPGVCRAAFYFVLMRSRNVSTVSS